MLELLQPFPAPAPVHKITSLIDVLSTYGSLPLRDYIKVFRENPAPHLQDRDDLVKVCAEYAERLLGPKTAEALARRLTETPVILTANHHGVDFLPMYVQSSLLFTLGSVPPPDSNPSTTVAPVFAYGSVSLNNATNPRGILLSRRQAEKSTDSPEKARHGIRINIFPDNQKNIMVSMAPPFARDMVERALKRATSLHAQQVISAREYEALRTILAEEYLNKEVLAQSCYSDQAVLLNHRLWKRFFAPELGREMPEPSIWKWRKSSSPCSVRICRILIPWHMRSCSIQLYVTISS